MIIKSLGEMTARMRLIRKWLGARVQVFWATKYQSGPRRIMLDADDVAFVCLIKDGAYYLDALLDHHRALGITSFLFIDNGSQDGTLEKLAAQPDVTCVSNTAVVSKYETLIWSKVAKRFIRGGVVSIRRQ